jgi:4-aminobutyrate aminotransferase/(S)-3-amino-2-methylpropionate transaminase
MPIAAVVGRADVMDAAAPGTIGGTYIGNPVCCAAALATIQYLQDHRLNERAQRIGEEISRRFQALQEKCTAIGDVRGIGAMQAMEFVFDGDPGKPDGELCSEIIARCAERGLILITAGTFKNVIRILTPLVITDEQLDTGLGIIEEVVMELTMERS